ncbi:longitudinals lacking protein, isoforms F/I/K/T-like [Pseudomyrmex gracilis]|uniref:longitudinals lacking protein, isoforms F/I/K/T-like n=1 Tax=Pseudomyrmex gracilis TaxID=219809 RepID=UPI000994F4B2|nr:longitudinals lacking protein, isoforms F/I/K/T-like [Pseudomyrmex gracilis]
MLERKTHSVGQESDESYLLAKTSDPLEITHEYSVASQYSGNSYESILNQHVCPDCGKKYKWYDSLKRHQRVDCGNKEKKFTCPVCDRKFKYRYELRNHIMAHHGVTFLPADMVNEVSKFVN